MPRLWEGRLYSHDQHPVAQTIGRAADFGQVAYGPDLLKGYRRAATCADRVPKGAKPPDLPVEQPSKFALVINFKTAKTPGLSVTKEKRTSIGRQDRLARSRMTLNGHSLI